ncbi:MAG: hypothetical protein IRZ08_18985 [Frankia sp.]|nr:hypothetical protein [Frankia sp.]
MTAGAGGYAAPAWSAPPGWDGTDPPGATGSFGLIGQGNLPGSIDPRLRPHSGPPRGQSRSISAPPPPHRSIHPDGAQPGPVRHVGPAGRRTPDDTTPDWLARRDPIFDGIDVI